MLKLHHFKDLPAPFAADIQVIMDMRLQQDIERAAIKKLLGGQGLKKALKNAMCDEWRQLRLSGFVSFGDEKEGDYNLKETVAASVQEPLERWHTADFYEATECLLSMLRDGTAAIGKALWVSQRRAQQILKKEIKRLQNGAGDDLFGEVKP